MRSVGRLALLVVTLLPVLVACSSDPEPKPKPAPDAKKAVALAVRDAIVASLADTKRAATDLATLAPTPAGRGWNAKDDAQAVAAMRDAWRRMRASFALYSAATGVLFPDTLRSLDVSYDQALGGGDPDPFDDRGVIGMHAVERILFADVIPAQVTDFEKTLPSYAPASFPTNDKQAADFKTKLCAKMVADVTSLADEWASVDLDFGGAYLLIVTLLQAQRLEMDDALVKKEESRYAQTSLAELRANLDGTQRAYGLFKPLLVEKTSADPKQDGIAKSKTVEAAFGGLAAVYAGAPGDALPPLPPKLAATGMLKADELDTPFGKVYRGVLAAADRSSDGSLADELNDMIEILGFPELRSKE